MLRRKLHNRRSPRPRAIIIPAVAHSEETNLGLCVRNRPLCKSKLMRRKVIARRASALVLTTTKMTQSRLPSREEETNLALCVLNHHVFTTEMMEKKSWPRGVNTFVLTTKR